MGLSNRGLVTGATKGVSKGTIMGARYMLRNPDLSLGLPAGGPIHAHGGSDAPGGVSGHRRGDCPPERPCGGSKRGRRGQSSLFWHAPSSRASSIHAPSSIAPSSSARVRSAPLRVALIRFASTSIAPARFASINHALSKPASSRSAQLSPAPANSAPANPALAKFIQYPCFFPILICVSLRSPSAVMTA